LMYPEEELGKKFWNKVYKKAEEQFGTREIPVNTFNKVWILPESAIVYEHEQTVYVVDAHLKVMLDGDYEAMQYERNVGNADLRSLQDDSVELSEQIIKEIIIPEIEREVNEGQHFAPLRQIYHSLILAKWYKETIKNSLLSQVYVDQNKIAGVESEEKDVKDKIYAQYMEAYKKGVFDFIKEDYDALSQEMIPRKYFSGGFKGDINLKRSSSPINESNSPKYRATVEVVPVAGKDLVEKSDYPMRLPYGVHEYWQELQGGWEAAPGGYPGYQEAIIARVRSFSEEKEGDVSMVLVELCCGKGELLSQLVDLPGVDHIVAVDINHDAMEEIQSRLGRQDLGGKSVELVEGNLEDADTQSRIPAADVIIMNDALMHFPQPEKVLDFVASRLKDGGLFINLIPKLFTEFFFRIHQRSRQLFENIILGKHVPAKFRFA